jgi:hypothetical protein
MTFSSSAQSVAASVAPAILEAACRAGATVMMEARRA